MIGAALAKAGTEPLLAYGIVKTASFIFISPMLGMIFGASIMLAVSWLFFRQTPRRVDKWFRRAQLVSSAAYSMGHGANDAQKTMGIIVGLLLASREILEGQTGLLSHLYLTDENTIPLWIEIGAYGMISLGTMFGGWRIVHTMGSRITKLRPPGGFSAETGGAMSILLATMFGIPVSTTHTISGAIVGVGTASRISAVRWGIAGRIVWAWVLTIPAAALMAAIALVILQSLIPM
jgi:PiT family inorganic phosphate transporter